MSGKYNNGKRKYSCCPEAYYWAVLVDSYGHIFIDVTCDRAEHWWPNCQVYPVSCENDANALADKLEEMQQ